MKVSAQDGRQIATAHKKSWISRFLFGVTDFGESEEYREFQFKLKESMTNRFVRQKL